MNDDDEDDERCRCEECDHEHLRSERIRGRMDSFGMIPLLCPKCEAKWFKTIPECKREADVISSI